MKKFRLRGERPGYSFTTVTRKGWLATLVIIILLLLSTYASGMWEKDVFSKDGVKLLLNVIIVVCLFTALYKDKVRGTLRWRFRK